jgi:hypothetical protein
MHFGIRRIELQRMARLAMALETDGLMICAGGVTLMAARALKLRTIRAGNLRG